MRTHRVGTHEHAGRVVAHASLTRRALAQLADTALLVLPAALLFWNTFSDLEQLVDAGPRFPLAVFLKMGVAMAWGLLGLAALAVTEGLWGRTPGKLVIGIRVVGTDLQPCGVGRAIVRNLLKVVDGFFNFLVGILMVAFTPDWQRLGDMAARTIVIRSGAALPEQAARGRGWGPLHAPLSPGTPDHGHHPPPNGRPLRHGPGPNPRRGLRGPRGARRSLRRRSAETTGNRERSRGLSSWGRCRRADCRKPRNLTAVATVS